MKYFIFSIDDGTIYDSKVIDIFNKYKIRGTFNLNSGLDFYTWYLGDMAIKRPKLAQVANFYKGHEIASHSLDHPHFTQCSGEHIVYEVGQDIESLERIFHQEINTFAFPFEDFDDRCINTIKYIRNIKVIRISEIDTSFRFPSDLHHVKITSMDVYDALSRINDFINDDNAQLFVFVSHAYDFEVNHTYSQLEELCKIVTSNPNIEVITMKELVNVFPK